MRRIHPPWIKTSTSANVAKRARALGIMRRRGIKPLNKAQARALLEQINSVPEQWTRE